MTTFSATVPARVALAGNPSDGYGGRVVATVVPHLEASVSVEHGTSFQVDGLEFATIDDLAANDNLADTGDAALFLASLVVAARRWPVSPCSVRWATSIPRSVGLSGSSALVIATLQTLAAANEQTIEPAQMPQMALAVEKLLGITAGLQDRVVQTFGGIQGMTFARRNERPPFTTRTLQPRRDLDLVVLYDTAAAEPSQTYHGELRQRYDGGDRDVQNAMRALARMADTAERSIETGDLKQLGLAMNESYDLRASISDLSPSHARLIDLARSCGLAANYAGSGGAIVGLAATVAAGDQLASAAVREHLGFHRWKVLASVS